MSPSKELTINAIKKKRQVPEELKAKSKIFAKNKKVILKALESGPKSIPEIAAETGLPLPTVTYYLMSLRKYGDIRDTQEINDDDFYLYELKGKE
jgi:hypothetical protein